MILEEPHSPRRSLKGESIRALREHLQFSFSSSSLPEVVDVDAQTNSKDNEKAEQLVKAEEPEKLQDDETKKQQPEAAASSASVAAARAADQVRSRLLQNLGIQRQRVQDGAVTGNPPDNRKFEPWGDSYTVPLNDVKKGAGKDAEKVANGNRKRKLEFNSTVQVHPIPSFRVYSDRIQQTIWTNASELADNVARNSLEFSYEDWNADHVLDEDSGKLIYFAVTGEWIHPVHFGIPPEETALSSDEAWNQTCHRLGILPAEFYHTLPTKRGPKLTRGQTVQPS